jgi:hypothetical protein
MASWGYTNENDGTDGQQPQYTSILRNYAHEWGHYEKQSSFWSNNKACLVNVENNIAFNAPRAGINFNVSQPNAVTTHTCVPVSPGTNQGLTGRPWSTRVCRTDSAVART